MSISVFTFNQKIYKIYLFFSLYKIFRLRIAIPILSVDFIFNLTPMGRRQIEAVDICQNYSEALLLRKKESLSREETLSKSGMLKIVNVASFIHKNCSHEPWRRKVFIPFLEHLTEILTHRDLRTISVRQFSSFLFLTHIGDKIVKHFWFSYLKFHYRKDRRVVE